MLAPLAEKRSSTSRPFYVLAAEKNIQETNMIVVDLFCKKCNKEEIDVFIDTKLPMPLCSDCNIEMTQMVAKRMSFELKYDNRKDICDWQGNTSNYWKQIKEDRAAGKKVAEPVNPKQPKWL